MHTYIKALKKSSLQLPLLGIVVLWVVLLFSGCASMGPGSIGRDRVDYDLAVSDSWQRQMLMNLVKLRYADAPFFLDVASITNSYGLQTQVNLTANWWGNISSGARDNLSLGGSGIYSDKPTITYNPLNGQRFTRSLMTPIPPGVVVSLIQSGWAADGVLRLMVSSANGVQNRFGSGVRGRGADPDFNRLCTAMRVIQASAAVGMRVEKTKDMEWAVLTLSKGKMSEETAQAQRTVRDILGLQTDKHEARIVFGSAPMGDDEIAMITRSLLEILTDLASSIEVPAADAAEGYTYATKVFETDDPGGFRPMIRIQSGPDRPEHAFVTIPYRDHWFWVDDRDFPSKQVFSYLLILMSLTDNDPGKGAPIITIPAG